MKFLILGLLVLGFSVSAQDYNPGVTYYDRGDIYGSDGSTIRWRGNTLYQGDVTGYQRGNDLIRSDGITERRRGNTIYRSDGVTGYERGNTTYWSNGVTCYQRGKDLICP